MSDAPQIHVVLVEPEIPQNTGNIGRMCAIVGARLHLVHPLGFTIEDRHLRRAGMDYWRSLDVHHHDNFDACQKSPSAPRRLWYLSRQGKRSFWDASFAPGDGLVFGRESVGLSPTLLHQAPQGRVLYVDQPNDQLRSLNLSTCAGIVTYEMLRQLTRNDNVSPSA